MHIVSTLLSLETHKHRLLKVLKAEISRQVFSAGVDTMRVLLASMVVISIHQSFNTVPCYLQAFSASSALQIFAWLTHKAGPAFSRMRSPSSMTKS